MKQTIQSFNKSLQKFGLIAVTCLTLLFIYGLPAHGQKMTGMTPTPTPTPMPKMDDMKSEDKSSQDDGMGDDMMGAGDLVPPGIMIGKAGKWMIGFQTMFEKMDGNLVGNKRISNEEVLHRFTHTPTDMTMQMYMGKVMYAPTDKLTLMVMIPFFRKSMNHLTHRGTHFVELAKGIGDIELRGALFTLHTKKPTASLFAECRNRSSDRLN